MSQPGTDLLRIAQDLRDVANRLAAYAVAEQQVTAPSPPPPVTWPPAPEPPELLPDEAGDDRSTSHDEPDHEYQWDWDRVEGPVREDGWTWDRVGGRVLAWVGGAVTVLGVVLLLVLAAQRGWLGPGPRLLCGAGMAAVLLAASLRVYRSPGGRIGAFALAATGFTVLYLDALGATVLYHYLPDIAGLLVALVIAGAGLLLADRWDSSALAMFVVLAAAACAPLVTRAMTPLLVEFLLVLAAAATPVQLRKDWRYLAVAAYGPPLVVQLFLDRFAHDTATDLLATVVVGFGTALLCVALAVVILMRARADDPVGIGLMLVSPVQVMAAAPLLAKWPAVTALAAMSALLFGIWAAHYVARWLPPRFAAAAGLAGATSLCHATFLAASPSTATLAITTLCQSTLFALTARQVASRGTLLVAAGYGAIGVTAALAGPVELTLLLSTPSALVPASMLVPAIAASALVLLAAIVFGWALARVPLTREAGAWAVIGIVALYGFSGVVLGLAMLASPDASGFRIGHLLITVGWTACAFVLLAKGINSLTARISGLALVGAAVLKLFAFDLVQLDGIIRVGAFLCTGVVLLIAGVRYAKLVAAGRSTDTGQSTS